jgi:hypothetical protein
VGALAKIDNEFIYYLKEGEWWSPELRKEGYGKNRGSVQNSVKLKENT